MSELWPVVAIMGPTASGKSGLALELAGLFKGEIISADSAQVYAPLEIGVAKPSPLELAQVVHHGVGQLGLEENFSLAAFITEAQRLIPALWRRGQLPLVVGGTGLYVRGLLEGYLLEEAPPDEGLRASLNSQPLELLLSRVASLDPATYRRLDRRNKRRVTRSLELILQRGAPLVDSPRRPPPYAVLKLALRWEREALYKRIDERLEAMLERGWLQEVEGLVRAGWAERLQELRILGYPQLIEVVLGRRTLEEARQEIKFATHRYAKRQETWLRREPGVHWLEASDAPLERAQSLVAQWLESLPAELQERRGAGPV